MGTPHTVLFNEVMGMTSFIKQFGPLILAIVGVLAIVATAWFGKDTEYENAFFYVFCIWLILYSIFEVYSKRKGKND